MSDIPPDIAPGSAPASPAESPAGSPAEAESPAGQAEFLLPIGHDIGPYLPDPDSEEYRFQIRIGRRIAEPDGLGFAIWLLVHDSEHGLPDRSSVLDAAASLGLPRAETVRALDGLLAEGLLCGVGPDSMRAFAETHQLRPLMVGLGPGETDPEARVVGLLDVPVVQMTYAMYQLWVWAHLRPNLWQACGHAAAIAREAGLTDPEEVQPASIASGLLSAVHPLLSARAAYLDVVSGATEPNDTGPNDPGRTRANERTVTI